MFADHLTNAISVLYGHHNTRNTSGLHLICDYHWFSSAHDSSYVVFYSSLGEGVVVVIDDDKIRDHGMITVQCTKIRLHPVLI